MATVVIVGGGSAGAPAARLLKKQLGPEHRVSLIEKEELLVNRVSLPLYAVGKRKKQHLSRSRSLLSRYGVELITGEVQKIDPEEKKIYTAGEELSYDLLFIAAGADLDRAHPPGAADAGIDLQNFDGAERIRAALPHFQGGEIAIVVASTTIRCPCGPYEYALLLEDWFRRRERSRDVSITIYTPEQAPLTLFGERVSGAVAGLLLNRNIRLHPGAQIRRIDSDRNLILFEGGGDSFPFDLLLNYAGAAPPRFIGESGLAGEKGWLEVESSSMALRNDHSIFAVGDVTDVHTPSGEPLPKTGAVAHLQTLAAAANIVRLAKGDKPGSAYSGIGGQIMETGRGALPFAGTFYKPVINFLPLPVSRLWSPLKNLLSERWWLKNHS